MNEPLLDIRNLSHCYGMRRALHDVSLTVAAGEILGLLGPNGSGKTTLFRVLSTLVRPQEGAVRVALPEVRGDLSAVRDAFRRHIGVVFQSPSLDGELSAEENLRCHGRLYGLSGGELAGRIDELLARLGVADRRHERVKRLSGGLRRRVELAKGLLNRPRLLLLDEPSTGVDVAGRIDLWRYLRQINGADGVTLIVTTHLMDEADQCQRLAILDQGRLVASGSPDELKRRLGGDVIRLRVRDAAAAARVLQGLGLQVEQAGGLLRLRAPDAYGRLPRIMEALPDQVEEAVVGRPTLEDVFIQATGHGWQGEG